jgi:hypothetical protein
MNDLSSIVLEKDGTHIADAEYFSSLPDQTIFLFLKHGEQWSSSDIHYNRFGA